MKREKTVTSLRRLATIAGGTLEEDQGYRDMRAFQIIAPDGMRWKDGVRCMLVQWAKGTTFHAIQHNESEYQHVASRLSSGLETIPAEEADFYAVD